MAINPSSLIRMDAWHSVYLSHLDPDKSGRQVLLYFVFSNLKAVFNLIRSSMIGPRILGTGRYL